MNEPFAFFLDVWFIYYIPSYSLDYSFFNFVNNVNVQNIESYGESFRL